MSVQFAWNTHNAQGYTATAIAAQLNAESWRPAKRRATFTAAMVSGLLARQGKRSVLSSPASSVSRGPGERTLQELANELAMPTVTLYSWLKQGKLKARQAVGHGHPVWLVQADPEQLALLRSWRAKSHSAANPT